jgi:hypothetical protein
MEQVKTLSQINESSVDVQAEVYSDRYAEQFQVYESFSIKSKVDEAISAYEMVALGQQLDQYINYQEFQESQGNLGSLGAIPQIALDVITASIGASIIPLVASVQPMGEEHRFCAL